MSLAINKEQLAVLAMKEAMAWLDQRGVYYQHFPPDQIKIGPINFWPRTGTITVDGEDQRRAEKGACRSQFNLGCQWHAAIPIIAISNRYQQAFIATDEIALLIVNFNPLKNSAWH